MNRIVYNVSDSSSSSSNKRKKQKTISEPVVYSVSSSSSSTKRKRSLQKKKSPASSSSSTKRKRSLQKKKSPDSSSTNSVDIPEVSGMVAAFGLPSGDEKVSIEAETHLQVPDALGFLKLETIDTIGDGTCMFHAFLLSTAPEVRRMANDERQESGKLFRHRLHDGMSATEKKEKPFAKAYSAFMQEKALTFLCDHFQVNVFGIAHQEGAQGKGRNKEEYDNYRCFFYVANPGAPYFLIFNYSNNQSGGADHYVAMRHDGKFLVDEAQVQRWKDQVAATPMPPNIMPFVSEM